MPTIIISVDCEGGQEAISVNDIGQEELDTLTPLLLEIQKRTGYFPTGDYLEENELSPEVTYRNYLPELKTLTGLLPYPTDGFSRIVDVSVVFEELKTLTM